MEYGTVISTMEGPSSRKFSFVINTDSVVRRGQFVQIQTKDGILVGRVADVRKTNRYFLNPESVKNVEKNRPMNESYPAWEWEYLVADVSALGVFSEDRIQDANFPVSPGEKVNEPDPEVLTKFFGLTPDGLHIGELPHHGVPVRLDMTRLFQKHLAVLALSGAGKSFMISGIIEELLDRPGGLGQIAAIVIDTHGEYVSFADDPNYSNRTRVFPVSDIRIGLPKLSPYYIGHFTDLNSTQVRELGKVMRKMSGSYTLTDLMKAIEAAEGLKSATKDVLLSKLEDLRITGLFGAYDYPQIDELARMGKLAVVDMSGTTNMRNKQLIVAYLAKKLFEARQKGTVPPFTLILEEAHQYVPEKMRKDKAIARGVLQTIAREGRKFNASLCLISQRPVQLSTTILSQCNSNIILKVTNPYDLDHIGRSSEGITRDVLDQISGLQVGTGLIVGEAVNFPLFVKIRHRKSKEAPTGMPLHKAALEYSRKAEQKKQDTKEFM